MGAYIGLAQTLVLQGRFIATNEFCDRAMGLPAELPGYPLSDVGEPRPLALTIWATALMALGYPAQALRRGDEALALGRRAGPYSLALALNTFIQLCHDAGDMTGVLQNIEALEAIANEHGFSPWAAQAIFARGRLLVDQGRIDEGIAALLEGAAAYEKGGAVGAFWRIAVADANAAKGAVAEGFELISSALEQINSSGAEAATCWAYLVEGNLHLRRAGEGAEQSAEASFRKSIEVARRQSAKLYELRATISLAELLTKQHRRREASAMLAEIHNWFSEGFEIADLRRAKVLLSNLSA